MYLQTAHWTCPQSPATGKVLLSHIILPDIFSLTIITSPFLQYVLSCPVVGQAAQAWHTRSHQPSAISHATYAYYCTSLTARPSFAAFRARRWICKGTPAVPNYSTPQHNGTHPQLNGYQRALNVLQCSHKTAEQPHQPVLLLVMNLLSIDAPQLSLISRSPAH